MYSDHASGSGYDMIVGTVCIHVSTYCMKSGFGVSPEHSGIQVNSTLYNIHVYTCISRPHGPIYGMYSSRLEYVYPISRPHGPQLKLVAERDAAQVLGAAGSRLADCPRQLTH